MVNPNQVASDNKKFQEKQIKLAEEQQKLAEEQKEIIKNKHSLQKY